MTKYRVLTIQSVTSLVGGWGIRIWEGHGITTLFLFMCSLVYRVSLSSQGQSANKGVGVGHWNLNKCMLIML